MIIKTNKNVKHHIVNVLQRDVFTTITKSVKIYYQRTLADFKHQR